MRLDKYIHVFNNAITTEFCDQIIEEYDDPDDWKPGTINDYEVTLAMWNKRLFGDNSYTNITLPRLDV